MKKYTIGIAIMNIGIKTAKAVEISTSTPTEAENKYYIVVLLMIITTVMTIDFARRLFAKHINAR